MQEIEIFCRLKQINRGEVMSIRIVIIDDEQNLRQMLLSLLRRQGFDVHACADGAAGIDFCLHEAVDVVLCDLQMPGIDGLEVIRRLQENEVQCSVIMMSAYATVEIAVEAMKLGAFTFITKPFRTEEVLRTIDKAAEVTRLRKENVQLRNRVETLQEGHGFAKIIGESEVLLEVEEQAKKVADYDSTVLITGESGTGKELFAQGIHNLGGRRTKPFLAVNCGAIPADLLESEFFGYEKGAFTGADRRRDGIFVAAGGGTVFLDEIAELSAELQVKLLRVLQEREVRPVGSNLPVAVDVRVIAATAKDLNLAVQEGEFRQDLLYRLNVIELRLPSLRERKEDIPLLVQHFITRFNSRFQRQEQPVKGLERDALDLLLRYRWPGNVRELENAVEHAFVYCEGSELRAVDLPRHLHRSGGRKQGSDPFRSDIYSLKEGKKMLERQFITRALAATRGNKKRAAELLEMSYPSLLQKIKEIEGQ